MKLSKSLQRLMASAEAKLQYLVESAKLDFSVALDRQRKTSGISGKDLAEKVGVSPAYISKVFRGDSNLTIETMVKLCSAAGGSLRIEVVPDLARGDVWKVPVKSGLVSQTHTGISVVQFNGVARQAANDKLLAAA